MISVHEHTHGHSHHHTSMKDIEHIIGHLNVPEKVKEDAIAVYKLIADAESHAHGCPVEEIHFHEVGAMDAVADIVGVCLAVYKLAPEQIHSFSCSCWLWSDSLCSWYSSNPGTCNSAYSAGNSDLWWKNRRRALHTDRSSSFKTFCAIFWSDANDVCRKNRLWYGNERLY